ncbi:MAG: 16S rRNA (guanine(527)-N(7))-methyltransferase RsmG [Chamaesiphon sp.]
MSEIETPMLPAMTDVWQQTTGWQPDAVKQLQFQRLYELILAGNQHLNLTRITTPIEFWEKHLWDSLRGVARLLSTSDDTSPFRVIDIGTGAGFPGLPVAIARPSWQISLLDATRKKISFLETLLAQLEIANATTLLSRVEAIGQDQMHRQSYDVALVRAVAPASVCVEYALPLLKIGGLAILYRGQWSDEDLKALQPVVKKLGGAIKSIEEFKTPVSNSIRHCLYLRKFATTPAEFPRPVGLPAQKPLY